MVRNSGVCMQGLRRNLPARDETGSRWEQLACGRRDCCHQEEDATNALQGNLYVLQACFSLDMESMLQEWRLV